MILRHFAAFLQNIATEPHTTTSVFAVRLLQPHFFAILSQLNRNEKNAVAKGGFVTVPEINQNSEAA